MSRKKRARKPFEKGSMLHITNGDSVVFSLEIGRVPGDKLSWKDVLHEGPVPAGLSLEELSKVRAAFIASRGWGKSREVRADFRRRDSVLAHFRDHEEVVLWFEHDLYDQLQLIQILGWFADRDLGRTQLTILQSPDYLGELCPEKLARIFPKRLPVTSRQLALGAKAWEAFRRPEPARLCQVIDGDTSPLPYLDGALLRLLEEYPSTHNGLSRSEERVLRVLVGRTHLADVYVGTAREGEERVFLSDLCFQHLIEQLDRDPAPIVRIWPSKKRFWGWRASITRIGRTVLAGKADWVHLRGIDRWIGGVHLHGPEAEWRWNKKDLRLVRRS